MQPTWSVVVFDFATWAARFPELATTPPNPVTEAAATEFFSEAVLYVSNGPTSRVPYNPPVIMARALILNLIVAHIARISWDTAGTGLSPLVGRVNAATQGSVNVTTDMPAPETASWWNQTIYGSQAYQMLARFRTARYIPAPRGIGWRARGAAGGLW